MDHIQMKLSILYKQFCKDKLNFNYIFTSFKVTTFFHIVTLYLMIWYICWKMNLLVIAAVLDELVKTSPQFKTRIERLMKKITNLRFLIIWILPWHVLTAMNISSLKQSIKLTLNLTGKLKKRYILMEKRNRKII